MRSAFLLGVAVLALTAPPSSAQDASALVGVWRLVRYEIEFKDGSPSSKLFGDNPPGYLIFTPKGRMAAVIEAAERKYGTSDAERVALFLSTVAYTGTYRVEGDRWITKVDAAWSPVMRRAEQVRFYKVLGTELQVTAAWQQDPRFPGRGESRGLLVWEKVE